MVTSINIDATSHTGFTPLYLPMNNFEIQATIIKQLNDVVLPVYLMNEKLELSVFHFTIKKSDALYSECRPCIRQFKSRCIC